MENVDLANFMLMFSQYGNGIITGSGVPLPERVFECKTCNRRFPSFQALGGHRASHKKPKATAASTGDHQGRQVALGPVAKTRAHECSVCGLEFSVGQALGGHMRRHRAAALHGEIDVGKRAVRLDLNLTPAENEMVVDCQDVIIGIEVVEKTVPSLPLLCLR